MASEHGAPAGPDDPYATASVYYGQQACSRRDRGVTRSRSFSSVDPALRALLDKEDTTHDMQITIEDGGSKTFLLRTSNSDGFRRHEVCGTYTLSNLLQELTLAKENGRSQVTLDEMRLNENPVHRLNRLIKGTFWDNLTRRIDSSVIEQALRDPKDWTGDPRPRIYVPSSVPEQYAYYAKVAKEKPETRLDVQLLPDRGLSPEEVKDLNDKPGLLALEMEECMEDLTKGATILKGLPFVVPGGRFNELYGWDSYFCALGLLISDKPDLVKSIVYNFSFEIKHYGKILNANRSYYLCRSQPPFLTDIALRTYEALKHEADSKEFLRTAISAAIKEYNVVWMAEPRYDPKSGLSRYRGTGVGVPPETEPTHFTSLLTPYARKYGMALDEFVQAYNDGTLKEPELDTYFLHDHAIRESGHDTSYRLEHVAADLATIDLNALLYKYETDIAEAIRTVFDDSLVVTPEFCANHEQPRPVETSAQWEQRARQRKQRIDMYLWNEQKGLYFDYNTAKMEQTSFESVTCLWALWSGVASPHQAALVVSNGLPKFECVGGLASTSKESRGEISLDRPNRQWDYPYGWAPHQILAWDGLRRYGFHQDAERLAYRWLHMMTKAFVDFAGVVVEKYDVTRSKDPHRANVEYGNQGGDFKGVAKEGFGWVNASYVYGLSIVNSHMKRALGVCAPYELYVRAVEDS